MRRLLQNQLQLWGGPDSSFAGHPAILKTGYDIRPDTGYFRHMMNYTKILKSLRMRKKCFINIRFAGYPARYLETGHRISGF